MSCRLYHDRIVTLAEEPAPDRDLLVHLAGCPTCRETALLITPPPARERLHQLVRTHMHALAASRSAH